MRNCNFCGIKMVNAVHERWCKLNPNLESNRKQHAEKISIGASERTKKAWTEGKMNNRIHPHSSHLHTEATKKIIKEKALQYNHRRLVRSTRKYIKKDGTIVLLDSSWEEILAVRLDTLNILWDRPKPMKWIDKQNNIRNYFPDFYLPEYNLYLDPKNPEAMRQQKEKVDWLKENIKNLIFLENIEQIKSFLPQ